MSSPSPSGERATASAPESGAGGSAQAKRTQAALERYYRFHSRVYDLTRWSFLFGRGQIIDEVAKVAVEAPPQRILEVGCGTGKNVLRLVRRFPTAAVTGLDLSAAMLEQARRNLAGSPAERLAWVHRPYDEPLTRDGAQATAPFDLILFSYSLTMINPGWEQALSNAQEDLAPGGLLAVVDFDSASVGAFRRWMAVNHVRMEGHLVPALQQLTQLTPRTLRQQKAYGGLWRYFLFVGQKQPSS